MNKADERLDVFLEILKTEYFPESEDGKDVKQRMVALKVAKKLKYSGEDVLELIYLDAFGEYRDECDLYEIKRLLVRSLIHIDIGGDLLVQLALDSNLSWDVRAYSVCCAQEIATDKNILKLKAILKDYKPEDEEIWLAILSVFDERALADVLPIMKSIQETENVSSFISEAVQEILEIIE